METSENCKKEQQSLFYFLSRENFSLNYYLLSLVLCGPKGKKDVTKVTGHTCLYFEQTV